mmetsp:Transcript_34355/g.91920  ORF Transcript_34355/g.91920 Transcript_34355/m.91920 type:complete len:251 (-) Transcript_34355:1674-2426(-)
MPSRCRAEMVCASGPCPSLQTSAKSNASHRCTAAFKASPGAVALMQGVSITTMSSAVTARVDGCVVFETQLAKIPPELTVSVFSSTDAFVRTNVFRARKAVTTPLPYVTIPNFQRPSRESRELCRRTPSKGRISSTGGYGVSRASSLAATSMCRALRSSVESTIMTTLPARACNTAWRQPRTQSAPLEKANTSSPGGRCNALCVWKLPPKTPRSNPCRRMIIPLGCFPSVSQCMITASKKASAPQSRYFA